MQVLRLEPHADATMTVTQVYGGKPYVANQFHTERMQQAFYDKGGVFGTSGYDGIVCVDYRSNDQGTRPFPGWATDVNGNGHFDDAGVDTDTFTNMLSGSEFDRSYPCRMWNNYLFRSTDYFWDHGAGGWNSGFRLVRKLPGGGYTNTAYYYSPGGTGYPFHPAIGGSGFWGPPFAVGDTDGDGIPDVYVVDSNAKKIWKLSDLNGNGNAMDAGEATVAFTFGTDVVGQPWDSWPADGTGTLELVDGRANGKGWCLIIRWWSGESGYWNVMGVIGLNASGVYDGNYKLIEHETQNPATYGPLEANAMLAGGTWMAFQPIAAPGLPPAIANLVATNVLTTSACLNGNLTGTNGAPTYVWVYWDTNNWTTNAASWAYTNAFTGPQPQGALTYPATGLSLNTTYWFTYFASNSFGTTWAQPSRSFVTAGAPPGLDNGGGATNIGAYSALLQGTLTSGASAQVIVYCGTDTNNWAFTNNLGTVLQASGNFSTNQTGLARGTAYYYQSFASNDSGTVWSPLTNFTTRPYVWITANTTCFENQTNQWAGAPVVVDGAGVVLTLSNSATYGNLPVYSFGNLIVTNGASVVGLSQGSMSPYTITNQGVAIQSAGDVIVADGCSINADGTGFAVACGPGAPANYDQGGTHGGRGEGNAAATYGSYTNPTTLGSGGGYFGSGDNEPGGGAIKLIVAGNLVVNGQLSANGSAGASYNRGGGAGGSLWITGGCTLGGTGEVQVSGGTGWGNGHGGGGGRLAMDDTVKYNFQGNIRGAAGYEDSWYGGAGTVYFPASAAADFTVYSNQTIVVGNDVTNVFGNLTVYGTLIPGGTYAGMGTGVVIQAANITIAPGGAISADGWGFGIYHGPAPANADAGWADTNAACHGGTGTNALYSPYGSATQPTSMGSGGHNYGTSLAAAGGAVKLVVAGALTVNGRLSARGLGSSGFSEPCGAGGSIWIDCGTLAGTNVIDASAGTSTYGSGGGRIAIYYKSSSFAGLPAPGLYTNMESISSTVLVKGGNVGSDGPEDGSIYIVHVVPMGTMVLFR
jgi:hypothetical protein